MQVGLNKYMYVGMSLPLEYTYLRSVIYLVLNLKEIEGKGLLYVFIEDTIKENYPESLNRSNYEV